jgi:hypothetical protein
MWQHLIVDNLIYLNKLEQLIRVQADVDKLLQGAGPASCARRFTTSAPLLIRACTAQSDWPAAQWPPAGEMKNAGWRRFARRPKKM